VKREFLNETLVLGARGRSSYTCTSSCPSQLANKQEPQARRQSAVNPAGLVPRLHCLLPQLFSHSFLVRIEQHKSVNRALRSRSLRHCHGLSSRRYRGSPVPRLLHQGLQQHSVSLPAIRYFGARNYRCCHHHNRLPHSSPDIETELCAQDLSRIASAAVSALI
jgi:hypothetical protein